MHLLRFLTLLPVILPSAQAQPPSTTNYGHWIVHLYQNWAPSGVYSKTSTHSQYFTPAGTLGEIVYCEHVFVGNGPGSKDTPCNDTSFSLTYLRQSGSAELYEIKQTVLLDGMKVALIGQKNITKTRSGAGTTLEATDRIEAMLVEGEGV